MKHNVGDIKFRTTAETLDIDAETGFRSWYEAIGITIRATSQEKTIDFFILIK